MIVKLQVLEDDINESGGRTRDQVILALDKVLKKAIWKSAGEDTWIIKQ